MYRLTPDTSTSERRAAAVALASEDVAHPLGREGLNIEDLVSAIAEMRAAKPGLEEVLVKLNEGVSGEEIALVDSGASRLPGTGRGRGDRGKGSPMSSRVPRPRL
jgi:hypothetical protein